MSRGHRRVSIYSLLAEGLLGAALAFAPLALGSGPPWTLWPIAVLVLGAALAAAVGAARSRQAVSVPLLAAAPALIVLACLLQLVPLPPALLALLSPPAAELRDFALVPLGLSRWRPVSLEPAATWRELAKAAVYLVALVTAAQLARSRSARRRLLSVLALTGTLVAAIGLVHKLANASALFGVYTFQGEPPLLSTFGNPNHLAAYLTLTGTVALGLALTAADRSRLLLWLAAFVAVGLSVFLSLSRGGIAFFVFGQALLGALYLRSRESAGEEQKGRRPWLVLPGSVVAAALAVVAVSGYVAYERIREEFETADSLDKLQQSKIELYPSMLAAAGHAVPLGLGRGAFEVGYTRYQELYPQTTFTHAENVLLQLLTELGAPLSLLVVAVALWGLGRLLRREGLGVAEQAAVVAVVAVGLHDLFDFALELPASALAAAALLGVASRSDVSTNGDADKAGASTARGARWTLAGVGAAAGLVALCAVMARPTLAAAEEELAAAVAAREPAKAVRERALPLIDQHPSDYLLFELVARSYSSAGAGSAREALAFVNRSLFLRPQSPEAHRVAARALLRLGKRSQAWLEYRLAHESGGAGALEEALRHAKGLDELRPLVSPAPERLVWLVTLLRGQQRNAEAEELASWALSEVAPGASAAQRRAVSELWLNKALLALSRDSMPEAAAAVEQAAKVDSDSPGVASMQAELLTRQGKAEEAILVLQAAAPRHPEVLDLSVALAQKLVYAGRPGHAREALARASPFVRTSDQRVWLLLVEAQTYEAESRYGMALLSFQTAARIRPERPDLHYQVARILERLSRFHEALEEVQAGDRAAGDAATQADWRKRLAEQEAAQKERGLKKELDDAPPGFLTREPE